MDPHYLDVENLNFGIDECEEFNPFEYEENLTPTSNPQSVPSSNSEHVTHFFSLESLYYNK